MRYRIGGFTHDGLAIVLDERGQQIAWGELWLDSPVAPALGERCEMELAITGTRDGVDWDADRWLLA